MLLYWVSMQCDQLQLNSIISNHFRIRLILTDFNWHHWKKKKKLFVKGSENENKNEYLNEPFKFWWRLFSVKLLNTSLALVEDMLGYKCTHTHWPNTYNTLVYHKTPLIPCLVNYVAVMKLDAFTVFRNCRHMASLKIGHKIKATPLDHTADPL